MYRLVSKLFDRGSGFRQRGNADQERIDLMRRQCTDDMTEAVALSVGFDREAGLVGIDCGCATPGKHLAAAAFDEARGGLGKKRRQIDACQQHITCVARGSEAVAQHVHEYPRGRNRGRRVERGDAQRPP